MYEQIEKLKENKSRTVANSVVQKKSNGIKGFVDNRPERQVLIQLKNAMNKKAQKATGIVMQLGKFCHQEGCDLEDIDVEMDDEIDFCQECGGDLFDYTTDGFDSEKNEKERNRIANLENTIRNWATRSGNKDSSGHGAGKKISSGNSKNRHQGGQARKVQHRSNKINSLESVLIEYNKAGGTVHSLQASTIKLLNRSGLSWREYL